MSLYKPKDFSFDNYWQEISELVGKIFNQENSTNCGPTIKKIYNICLWGDEDDGSSKLKEKLSEQISHIFIYQIQFRLNNSQVLLKSYLTDWKKLLIQISKLKDVFLHFQKSLVTTTASMFFPVLEEPKSVVENIVLDQWRHVIFPKFNESLLSSAIKLIDNERNGESIDSQLIIDLRKSYIYLCSQQEDQLNFYNNHFLKAYVEATEIFYKINAAEYLRLKGVDDYMKYAVKQLKDEIGRADRYLIDDSSQFFKETCVKILISSYSETIVAECPRMMKRNETDKLRLMLALFDLTPDSTPLLNAFEKNIVDSGLANMKEAAATIVQDPEKYVDQLVNFFNRSTQLITESFGNDHRFVTLKDKAFKIVINDSTIFKLQLETRFKSQPESKFPELLAVYCDSLLKKTSKIKLTTDQINNKLDDAVLLLPYIVNKDVFIEFYKTNLARRLILGISVDSEIEESVINTLRNAGMPTDCTNKLAKMIQDVKLSKDLNDEIKRTKPTAKSINVKILNKTAWIRTTGKDCVCLPVELEDYIPDVEEFYKKKHSGRKLEWLHRMSTGIITFVNQAGKFDLEINTFQMAVLFAWNERPKERISLENLKLATKLSDVNLRKALWSLVSFPKRQVLLFDPKVKSPNDFDTGTEFWVNQEFSVHRNGKPVKIGKLNMVGKLQLTSGNEEKHENEEIVKVREFRIQEVIVKIMKTKITVTSAQLHSESVELLKNLFLPSKKMIKHQIEYLIHNEYIRRDENNINSFIYLA